MDALAILVDVDHTLLDGAAVRARLSEVVAEASGSASGVASFWAHYEGVRADLGRVDMPEITRRLEHECAVPAGSVLAALEQADFSSCLYEGALEALAHLGTLGVTAVLSDGDERFQRAKITSSGIAGAVAGRVLIATHKERELDEVQRRFPAEHYVLIDDRATILAAVKSDLGARVTTVLVRQGRYADELAAVEGARPDIELASIRDALGLDGATLRRAAA